MINSQENSEKIPPHKRISSGVPDFSAEACRLSFSTISKAALTFA
jgi:hypothetical protein